MVWFAQTLGDAGIRVPGNIIVDDDLEKNQRVPKLANQGQSGAELVGVISSYALEALAKQARDLSLLLEASTDFFSIHQLDELLALFCRRTVQLVDCTFSRVFLLQPDGAHLVSSASYSQRALEILPQPEAALPLEILPWHQLALVRNEPIVLRRDDPQIKIPLLESVLLFGARGNSSLLLPLSAGDTRLGVVALCEVRAWNRTSFDDEKANLAHAISRQAALAAMNVRAYESIASQNERRRLLIESLADGVLDTDLEGRIVSLNSAATRLLGYSIEEVYGQRCADTLHGVSEDGRPLCEASCPLKRITDVASATEPIQTKEWVTCRDGRTKFIAHDAAPLKDGSGRVVGAISIIRDISREEQCARLNADLISLVSHELAAPLTDISLATELLEATNLDESRQKDILRVVSQESTRLVHLVDEVREVSRLEMGQLELNLQPLLFMPILARMVRTYETQHGDHHFRIQVPDVPVIVLGNLSAIEVILKNLLQNAVLYSPAGTTITVNVCKRVSDVLVSVSDLGIGIAPDQIERVFERFYRVPDKAGNKVEGSGLGLYMARILVEAQGGKIWAASESGHGSCFSFVLNMAVTYDEKEDSGY
jgi:two-component system phosphate regulon sensor histidine kinase PhoR